MLFVSSALSKIITTGFKALQLQYFFTAGKDEVKAWTILVKMSFPLCLYRNAGYIVIFQSSVFRVKMFCAKLESRLLPKCTWLLERPCVEKKTKLYQLEVR